jgi:Obg family GTPase CgtA-like protein
MLESVPRPRREGAVAPVLRREPGRDRMRVDKRDGQYVVESVPAMRIVERVDMDDYRVRLQLLREFHRLGVAKALEAAGIKQGDTIRVGDKELRW